MADFRLSHTAQEVDELLSNVRNNCLPVVIDLKKYEHKRSSSESYSVNDEALMLFSGGGGTINLGPMSEIWNDVNTDRPVKLLFDLNDFSESTMGLTIVSDIKSITKYNGIPVLIETSFHAFMDDTVMRATVVFNDTGTVTMLTVTVEPMG